MNELIHLLTEEKLKVKYRRAESLVLMVSLSAFLWLVLLGNQLKFTWLFIAIQFAIVICFSYLYLYNSIKLASLLILLKKIEKTKDKEIGKWIMVESSPSKSFGFTGSLIQPKKYEQE